MVQNYVEPPQHMEKFLVFIATTTDEKVKQYQYIAEKKQLPILFKRLNHLVESFHSAPENTRTADGNAEQKLGEIKEIIAQCQISGSPLQNALKSICYTWDMPFKPANLYFATDDTTFMIPRKIWDHLREDIKAYVPTFLLDSADNDSLQAGPGAESGPILSAVGVERFFDLLRKAALKANFDSNQILIESRTTFLLHPLAGSLSAPPLWQRARVPLYLYAPQGLQKPFPPSKYPLPRIEDYVRTKDVHQSVSEHWEHYLVEKSARSEIVNLIATRTFKLKINGRIKHASPSESVTRKPEPIWSVGLPIGSHTGGLSRELLNSRMRYEMPEAMPRADGSSGRLFKVQDALDFDNLMRRSDGLVFTEFDPDCDPETRRLNYLAVFSAKVAKELIARDMNKPIVLIDNGCWQDLLSLSNHVVNMGMSKDFMQPVVNGSDEKIVNLGGVTHTAYGFLHVVSGADKEKRRKAAVQILQHAFKHYTPFPSATPPAGECAKGGQAAPNDMFNVAVFVSAGNDNKRLLGDMRKLGNHLARQHFGLVWGAGDRHAMGAVYEGYQSYSSAHPETASWTGGFSTEPILKAETEGGCFPAGVSYWEMNHDIYQRMAHMISKSNAIVIAPGGNGTVQEWLAALALKHRMPELMKDKPLVLYSPDLHATEKEEGKVPFWEKGIRVVMGDAYYEALRADHHAFAKDGIYFATSLTELKKLVRELGSKGHDANWGENLLEKRRQKKLSPNLREM